MWWIRLELRFITQWRNLTPAWLGSHRHSSLIHHTMTKLNSSLTAIQSQFQSNSSHNDKLDSSLTGIPFPFQSYSSHNEKTWLQPDWGPIAIPVLFITQWENLTPAWLRSHFHSSQIDHTMRKLDSSLTAIQSQFQSNGIPVRLESSFLIVWSIWLECRWDPSQAGVKFSHCVMNKTGMEMGSQSGWSQVFSLCDE